MKYVETVKVRRRDSCFQKFARQMVSEGAMEAVDTYDQPQSKVKVLGANAIKWTRRTRRAMSHG